MTEKDNLLTSVRLHYGLEGDESLKDRSFEGFLHGRAVGSINESGKTPVVKEITRNSKKGRTG